MTPRWLEPQEQAAWRAWLDVHRLLDERLGRDLARQSGFSMSDYEVLVQLSEAPDRRLRMSELADLVVQSRSRLTHGVARLECRGLVARTAVAGDGRGVVCELTDAGFAELAAAAPGHVESVRQNLFDQVQPEEVEVLGRALARVRAHLQATSRPTPTPPR